MLIRKLSEELQKKAEEELNENISKIEEYLENIRKWLLKQPHLTVRDDDQTLVTFLRGCKYSLQKTKDKIEYYYGVRNTTPFFTNRDPFSPDIQEILNSNVVTVLPKLVHPNGPRIILASHENCKASIITMESLMKMFLMTVDVLLNEDDNAVVSGIIFVLDCKGFDLNYLTQFTPMFVQHAVKCLQVAYPIRLKKIIAINVPAAAMKLYELLKYLLGGKLQQRVSLYGEGDLTKCYEIVPKSILPLEVCGEAGSFGEMTKLWKKKVESYRDWFNEDSKYCLNEKLRMGLSKLDSGVYGAEGSFMQLNID